MKPIKIAKVWNCIQLAHSGWRCLLSMEKCTEKNVCNANEKTAIHTKKIIIISGLKAHARSKSALKQALEHTTTSEIKSYSKTSELRKTFFSG